MCARHLDHTRFECIELLQRDNGPFPSKTNFKIRKQFKHSRKELPKCSGILKFGYIAWKI